MKLPPSFFERSVVTVARELIGKRMMVAGQTCWIRETEAYGGTDDPASHANRGPTPRSSIMFGPSGRFYVYLIYGMHHCVNIVAHEQGHAGAVLIRGIQFNTQNIDGPGRVCRRLNITREQNDLDLTKSDQYCLIDDPLPNTIECLPRIGIRKATNRLWRFRSTAE